MLHMEIQYLYMFSLKNITELEWLHGYDVKDKRTGETVIIAETKHCFTDVNLRPINLKKKIPEYSNIFESLMIK